LSTRDENRKWLEDGARRWPDGWEARSIRVFGLEGSLDVLAAQSGDPFGVNLTHRPFAGNNDLKLVVTEAREAVSAMTRALHEHAWQALQAAKADEG